MEESKFQFKKFAVLRSLIERKNDIEPSKRISVKFNPSGVLNKSNSTFQLHLEVKIENDNKAFNIEIVSIADFVFNSETNLETLNKFFYINAPALLFPYIRAYISTLTNLSGFNPINLPTLNMSRIGEDLRKNTTEM